MPKWAELWERDHSLRPENTLQATSEGHLYWTGEESKGRDLPLAACAALWRDAAVRWFIKNDGEIVQDDTMTGFGVPRINASEFDDAAIFAACKAILDARDAPCPS